MPLATTAIFLTFSILPPIFLILFAVSLLINEKVAPVSIRAAQLNFPTFTFTYIRVSFTSAERSPLVLARPALRFPSVVSDGSLV